METVTTDGCQTDAQILNDVQTADDSLREHQLSDNESRHRNYPAAFASAALCAWIFRTASMI